ncbi:integrase [Actinobacillus succinogenes]|nr:integrase [Actinobacillus succinogenes]
MFEEALLLYVEDAKNKKDFDTSRRHAIYWRAVFSGWELKNISGEDINANLPTHSTTHKKALSPSTKNRYRTSILRVMSLAYKNGWVDRVPYVPKYVEPKVRVRWITKAQAAALIANLNLAWMKNVCSFALLTGARMTEILSLTWDKVDFDRSIAIVSNDVAKSGKARALPLNKIALDLLKNLKQNRRNEYVFHRDTDKRIGRIDWHDFHQALNKSGIDNFRFHDLRHTWASWHVQAGTPLYTLKEMGGWETLEMVKKYAHLNATHMLEYAENVTFTPQSNDDFSQDNFYNVVNY